MENTIRFGSSCGPQATPSCGREDEEEKVVEEFDDSSNADPDKLLQCPYDKNHHIRACRFPYHLIKCGKNHPKLVKEFKTCPFNARHRLPKCQFQSHIDTCPNKRPTDSEEGRDTIGSETLRPPVSTWVNTNMTEDWDEELEDNPTVFVLGRDTASDAEQHTRLTNNLGPSFRTPINFPWSD